MKKEISNVLSNAKFVALFVLVSICCNSCGVKETKAEKLIKSDFSKTLYDFESYEPIETTLTKAKANLFTDTSCHNLAMEIVDMLDLANSYVSKAEDASHTMSIWGTPSAYSSSYSDSRYREAKDEYESFLSDAQTIMSMIDSSMKELRMKANKIDTNDIIGWEVNHTFRCKTRGGMPTIGNYRYVIDKKCKKILIKEDLDDEDVKTMHNYFSSMNDSILGITHKL